MLTPAEIERTVVLVLLSGDLESPSSRRELVRLLGHLPPRDVGNAILRLGDEGVHERRGEDVWASRPTRRLDELGLIAV